jgi:hypothetical protein
MEQNQTANLDSGSLDALVRRLYETRLAAKLAKQKRREFAEKSGGCENHDRNDTYPECGTPCYQKRVPQEQWCATCKQSQPLHEDYHNKTNAAAAALRSLIRVGATLPPNVKLCDGGSGGLDCK